MKWSLALEPNYAPILPPTSLSPRLSPSSLSSSSSSVANTVDDGTGAFIELQYHAIALAPTTATNEVRNTFRFHWCSFCFDSFRLYFHHCHFFLDINVSKQFVPPPVAHSRHEVEMLEQYLNSPHAAR